MSLGMATLSGMALILWHLSHIASEGSLPASSGSFAVALVIGPISSITAITIAIFVGAIKRFEENDADKAGQALNAGATTSRFF